MGYWCSNTQSLPKRIHINCQQKCIEELESWMSRMTVFMARVNKSSGKALPQLKISPLDRPKLLGPSRWVFLALNVISVLTRWIGRTGKVNEKLLFYSWDWGSPLSMPRSGHLPPVLWEVNSIYWLPQTQLQESYLDPLITKSRFRRT